MAETSEKSVVASPGAAESGAVGAQSDELDADLRAVIEAWPTLSEADRRAVLTIVGEAGRAD